MQSNFIVPLYRSLYCQHQERIVSVMNGIVMDQEKFAAARRASGLTVDRAAQVCEVSRPTYTSRERYPLDFRLSELARLYEALDDTGKRLLLEAVNSTFA